MTIRPVPLQRGRHAERVRGPGIIAVGRMRDRARVPSSRPTAMRGFILGSGLSAAVFLAGGVLYGWLATPYPRAASGLVAVSAKAQATLTPPRVHGGANRPGSVSPPRPEPTATQTPALVAAYVVRNTGRVRLLNVRAAPSLAASRIGLIAEGEAVEVLRAAGAGWAEVQGADFQGYVASAYLHGPTAVPRHALAHLRPIPAAPTASRAPVR